MRFLVVRQATRSFPAAQCVRHFSAGPSVRVSVSSSGGDAVGGSHPTIRSPFVGYQGMNSVSTGNLNGLDSSPASPNVSVEHVSLSSPSHREPNAMESGGNTSTTNRSEGVAEEEERKQHEADEKLPYASPFLRSFLAKRKPVAATATASSESAVPPNSNGGRCSSTGPAPTNGTEDVVAGGGPAALRGNARTINLRPVAASAPSPFKASQGGGTRFPPAATAFTTASSAPVMPPSGGVAQTSTSGSALSSPYPTEGGHVPIFIVVNGFVQKRNWIFRNSNWCDLCKEPVDSWVNHHGRKDHALLDMHYTALVEYKRRWNPEALLRELGNDLAHADLEHFHQWYSRTYDRERRNELYAMMVALEEAKVLHFGEPRQTFLSRMQGGMRGMDLQGALVLHEFILGPFMRLYPDGHIQDFSNLVDFITCAYNMETVYDLCAFYTLDKIAIRSDFKPSSPAALGLGGIAAHSSAGSGYQQDVRKKESAPVTAAQRSKAAAAAAAQADLDEEAFSRKATFMRQILGQLRWVSQPGQKHPAGYEFPPHIVHLAEICLKALVVEIVCVRFCEYMVRAEPVWRDHGYERMKRNLQLIARNRTDVVPEPVKYFYRRMSPALDDFYSVDTSRSASQSAPKPDMDSNSSGGGAASSSKQEK